MSKFDKLKSLDIVAEKTATMKLYQITVNGKTPVLILKPAGSANKPYFNALLKRSAKSAQMVQKGNISLALIEENREEDRDLFPKYVIVGWEDMLDLETGDPIPFTEQDAADFLEAIPNWMFDEIRTFASNSLNFTEAMDIDIGAKAKNSASG